VRHQQQSEDHPQERADVGGQRPGLAFAGQGVEAAGEDDGEEDEAEFGAASGELRPGDC
jgi:hypothetical protein